MNVRKQFFEAYRVMNGLVNAEKEMHDVTFPMAAIQDALRVKDVKVFELNECDAVAAYTLEDAIEWYTDYTGIEKQELYSGDDVQEIDRSHSIWEDELMEERTTVGKIIDDQFDGEPFIVYSTEF